MGNGISPSLILGRIDFRACLPAGRVFAYQRKKPFRANPITQRNILSLLLNIECYEKSS